MAKYVKLERLKQRLENKVRFAAAGDNSDPNLITMALFNDLVNEAEVQLEIDLMMRYDIPLRAASNGFEGLPASTQTILRTMAELISVIRVLETDFGRGTATNGDKYTSALQKRYDAMVAQLVEIKKETYQTWLRPPLAGLALAYSNQGDTGLRARIHNTGELTHEADYAYKQINSPGENIWNGTLDPLDVGNVPGVGDPSNG